MRIPPAEILTTWPKANYIDPETRGPGLIIVEIIILPLALLTLFLRLYVRIGILHKSGWDDWLMVAAAVFGTGVTTCVILASTKFGWDMHIWDLNLDNMTSGRQVSIAVQALFVLATSFAKVSILTSYLRFAPLDSWFRRITYTSMGVILVSNFIFFVILWTQCTYVFPRASFPSFLTLYSPTASYWNLFRFQTDCMPEEPPLMVQAVLTVLADFIVWVLPLPTLFAARLPRNQRLALIVLFSFGFFVVFASCMRTYWIHYVVQETYDVTWEGFDLWIWTAVEVHLGVMCGCVPCLKSLFKGYQAAPPKKAGYTGGGSRATVGPGLAPQIQLVDQTGVVKGVAEGRGRA
ncbi:hypothetical protein B0H67DRAFT_549831 [Lasiosphaeris hirsuta]|uniref:Rhodopsin domain-containing protein n=1 Tax=Lasiosphaeris hirsuta TaxID=260670 RepID=A0AA40BDH1_9PEZI|nr:hypothetical protein B0H67DRAFT_549831 [Lasiosphaeris hirsuta]